MNASPRGGAIGMLRAFARSLPASSSTERCDVCGVALPEEHPHLVAPGALALTCACAGCAAAPPAPLSRVAPRVRAVDAARAASVADRLALPVGLAFLVLQSDPARLVARFPGPAGATLGELPDGAAAMVAEVVSGGLHPDVEALLLDRRRGAAFVVSIDRCFELAGLARAGADLEPFFSALAVEAARD